MLLSTLEQEHPTHVCPYREKQIKRIHRFFVFALLPVLIWLAATRLFYLQYTNQEVYVSDILGHIKAAQRGGGYSGLVRTMGFIIKQFDSAAPMIIAAIEGLLVAGTIVPMGCWISKAFRLDRILSFLVAEMLIFLCSPYIPLVFPYFYKFGGLTQPWHNITYIGMRFFAALTLALFSGVFERYREHFAIRDWLCVAVPLTVTTIIKPNFLIAFSWTLLVFLVCDAVRGRFSKRTILNCIKLGTVVFPAVIVMFFQGQKLYDDTHGITIKILESRFFSQGYWFALFRIIRVFALPTSVVIFMKIRNIKIARTEWFLYFQFIVSYVVAI